MVHTGTGFGSGTGTARRFKASSYMYTDWSYVLATQVSSMCHGVNRQSLVENDTQCIGSVCIAL